LVFMGFYGFLQEVSEIVPDIKPWLLLSTSFTIHVAMAFYAT
jgi:hypothetical protein